VTIALYKLTFTITITTNKLILTGVGSVFKRTRFSAPATTSCVEESTDSLLVFRLCVQTNNDVAKAQLHLTTSKSSYHDIWLTYQCSCDCNTIQLM